MPKVSVIMPAYNAEKTVKDAVESVLRQTFTDFELIIINDCSLDSTAEILKGLKCKDSRIIYFENEKNSGVSETRNYGIKQASGNWIAFLDSDDIWLEDKLEKQLAVLDGNPNAVICYTATSFIDKDGGDYSYVMQAENKTSYKTLLKRNIISCSSVVIRSDIMKSINMPGDYMHEDYYTWLTVLKQYGFAYGVNEPLLKYRLSANSKSANRIKSAKMIFNTYRAVGYSLFSAIFFTFRYAFYSISKRRKIKAQ